MQASTAASMALEPEVLARALLDARTHEASAAARLAAAQSHAHGTADLVARLRSAAGECTASSATAPLLERLSVAAVHAHKVSSTVRSLDRAARRVEQSAGPPGTASHPDRENR